MVVFVEWLRTAAEQKSSSGLPMTGEDTGLGALASPMVGYLGKVQERCTSLDYCPWCSSKGLTFALRSYRINLQESVSLCTNTQCLFPLVSRSLEDILAALHPVDPVGNKRKSSAAPREEESPLARKRLRSDELDRLGPRSVTDAVVGRSLNGLEDSPVAESSRDEDDVLGEEPQDAAPADPPPACETSAGIPRRSSEASSDPALAPRRGAPGASEDDVRQAASPPEVPSGLDSGRPLFTNNDIYSVETLHSERTARTEQTAADVDARPEQLVSVPGRLFWRNSDSLCWLDSLLVAVVNCRSLTRRRPPEEPQKSPVWQLIRGYEDVCAAVRVHQQTGRDGVVRVPNHLLRKANADLQRLRMSIFKLLQPKLHCKLGRMETPVFAMPLLLNMDSWAEPLFQSTFHWEFRCSRCKTATKERVVKTLPTFTNVLPDWRPLAAAHLSPCNVCCRQSQRRTMMLDSLSPVFQLHFVDGLPDADVRLYSFTFQGRRFSVTTVIQYHRQLKHFVTWTRRSDGCWLEYDDLKHPDCKTHRKLEVPAQEIHVVFWEEEEEEEEEKQGAEPRACSPSSTFSEFRKNETQPEDDRCLHDDTADIACALTTDDTDATLAADASIGSTTLLDAFEGLSSDDIITLTLVELKVDSEQTEDSIVGGRNDGLDSTPDSSCAATPPAGDAALAASSSSSSDSADGSSNDPTFVPAGRRERGRAATRQTAKKAAAPRVLPPASPEAFGSKPATAETTPRASPVSSTGASPPIQESPVMAPQSARWSYLVSRHPLNHVSKAIAKPAPTRAAATSRGQSNPPPPPPAHSTPNPVRKPPAGLFPKPQLRTEDAGGGGSLPLKAAEMYGGFGAKTTAGLPPTPALLSGASAPVKDDPPTSLPSEISSSSSKTKKRGGRSWTLPAGVSDTDVLRYKLIKKLKAKKKKLAALNEKLSAQGGGGLRPDSTALCSPATVTSSTYDGSVCDDFLSDLLSPATTVSNLSPDSTGFLETRVEPPPHCGVDAASHVNDAENFLDEFLSQAAARRATEAEAEALSALELFM